MSPTTYTLEEQKLEYSRQLAEHTLRQWNSVRQTEVGRRPTHKTRRKSSTKFVHVAHNHSSDTDEEIPKGAAADGVQVVDYGKLSLKMEDP
ncbi:hypothetical protein BDP27DRAFT_1416896 [Rhodocollybia butyracea]|uniref:Uncharacterized protein n=1 Tax=Rhodocollybia butyracea TaxID=206335 RepID=A0A9P5Q1M3_9AGAR|nr:hypothetical protein BDP27DRAFT_1416896 [Rhodocollybia butyracea]